VCRLIRFKISVWCMVYGTFLREGVEGVGGGVRGEEVVAVVVAALDVVVFDAAAFGSDGGFDAVALADEEVPAENLGKAVHHVVELLVFHVHQRAHREPKLGDLRRRVVADAVGLEKLLQSSELARSRRPCRVERRGHRRGSHRVFEEGRARGRRRSGWEDGTWVPLE